ncbi:peptide-methionine (S)-S-oxide reductase MsrA [soil metagenome]
METITLGGGCFWCTEAIFKKLKGVKSVLPGYSGGTVDNPTYEDVSSGNTRHAEATQIEFDPKIISLKEILTIFFKTHDPTTLNRQGADVGTQYRSAIFFHNENQKQVAEDLIKELQPDYGNKIVTEVTAFDKFYLAEDYHKNYYETHKNALYCKLVIDPKLNKLKKEFGKYLS